VQVRPAEIVIIALLAIVLLCLAFLFYNQTLLREEIKNDQTVVQQAQPAGNSVAMVRQTPTAALPTPAPKSPQNPATAQGNNPQRPATPRPTSPTPSRPAAVTSGDPEFSGAPYLDRRIPSRPPAAPNTPAPQVADEKAEEKALADYGPTVEQIITELYRGNYPAVLKKCTADYANLVGPALATRMDEIRTKHGNLKAVMGRRLDDNDASKEMKVFHFTVDTDKGQIVKFTVTVQTNDKKVAGLYFRQVPVGG
jgi:hypothetical protein